MLPFATKMHQFLPREIRDLIYSYLLGMEPVRSNRPTAIEKVWQTASRSFGWCPRQDHAIFNGQCPCFPYFIRPEYVGIEVAGEIVEVWLKSKPRGDLIGCDGFDRERIEKIVCEDVLSVKLDPTIVLRAFPLTCTVSELAIGENEDGFPIAAACLQVLEPLYRIKNKSGFHLLIEVYQRQIRLNQWPDIFSIFQPVLKHFEREGAHVNIRFSYSGKGYKDTVQLELNDLVRQHDPDTWKRGVIEQLEQVC